MRLIDGDALIVALKRKAPISDSMRVMLAECLQEVRLAPTIDPERKKGKWIRKDLKWECDQCGCRIRRAKPFSGNMWNYYYCPNCGAKMEEGEQE